MNASGERTMPTIMLMAMISRPSRKMRPFRSVSSAMLRRTAAFGPSDSITEAGTASETRMAA